jgi:hypothetical protein
MLEIYTKEGWLPITNRQNYYTSYEYDGTQTLCFDISPVMKCTGISPMKHLSEMKRTAT